MTMQRAKAILLAFLLALNVGFLAGPSIATVVTDSSKTNIGWFSDVDVTGSIDMASGSVLNLYNTADQTTNYERLRADWSGNVARIYTQAAGTGVVRGLALGSGTTTLSSGTFTAVAVNPTINQSGTAGATILNVDPTVSASGSGTYLAQRWGWNGTAIAQINSIGTFTSTDLSTANYLTFRGGSLSATQDVFLIRDAADTLALRRTTNAQTFRVYNTYTDASNYERTGLYWSSNVAYLQNQNAGTGSARLLVPVTGATTVSGLPTCNSALTGGRSFVTDANSTTFAAAAAGGGANAMPVVCNGTGWIIGEAANDPAYQLTAQG